MREYEPKLSMTKVIPVASRQLTKTCFLLALLAAIILPGCDKLDELVNPQPTFSDVDFTSIEDKNLRDCAILNAELGENAPANAADFIVFFCSTKTVVSIEGLEQFKNLDHLDLDSNRISSIDLSPFPKLRFLNLSKNRLSTVDLSHNPELLQVDLSENSLTSIDLSTNVELEDLVANDNNLSDIDLSKNTGLRLLNLANNNFSGDVTAEGNDSLNLSNNSQLNTLTLNDNAISRIRLEYDNEEPVECGLVELAECAGERPFQCLADISSGCLAEIPDECSEALPPVCNVLSDLFMNDNELDSINLFLSANLSHVELNNNNLTRVNLSNNKVLDTVWLNDNQISEISLPMEPPSGEDNLFLGYLYLANNNISCEDNTCSNESYFKLPPVLAEKVSPLIHVDLSGNNLSNSDIDLEGVAVFSDLILSDNELITGTFDLEFGKQLVELDLSGTNVTDLGLDLENNSSIEYDNENDGPFQEGETLTFSSGGSAVLDVLADDGVDGNMLISMLEGSSPDPRDGDMITGMTSGATANVVFDVTKSFFDRYSLQELTLIGAPIDEYTQSLIDGLDAGKDDFFTDTDEFVFAY